MNLQFVIITSFFAKQRYFSKPLFNFGYLGVSKNLYKIEIWRIAHLFRQTQFCFISFLSSLFLKGSQLKLKVSAVLVQLGFELRLILNQPWFQFPERKVAPAWDTGKNYHVKQLSYLTLQKVLVMNMSKVSHETTRLSSIFSWLMCRKSIMKPQDNHLFVCG